MSNPLQQLSHPVPFDKIEAAHVKPALEKFLDEAEQALSAIEALETEPTWANTMAALEDATAGLEECFGIVQHLDSVMTSPEMREAYVAMLGPVTDFFTGIVLRPALWSRSG